MAVTRTFSIIKPDATRRNLTGAVTKMLEEAGLRVVASKRIHMTREQAEGFYAVHRERPFFGELVEFMISGPVVVQVLEGEDAVKRNRDIMGATNPANAEPGTIRKGTGRKHRGKLGPWFGQRRECRDRDRVLLQAGRNCRLICPSAIRNGAVGAIRRPLLLGPPPSQATRSRQNSAAMSMNFVSRFGATLRQLRCSQSAIWSQSVRPRVEPDRDPARRRIEFGQVIEVGVLIASAACSSAPLVLTSNAIASSP
jgi:nucleoside-diphosphate kinase